jgi:arylsulfatase A-like enzyme
MDGRSARQVLKGSTPGDWPHSMYYRYWLHGGNWQFCAHYGVRTDRYKLIYYYADPLGKNGTTEEPRLDPEWELFDLEQDPLEWRNLANEPEYAGIRADLKEELDRLQAYYADRPEH